MRVCNSFVPIIAHIVVHGLMFTMALHVKLKALQHSLKSNGMVQITTT